MESDEGRELVDEDRDLWKLVIFDYGGFFPAKGKSKLQKARNARAESLSINSRSSSPSAPDTSIRSEYSPMR